MTEPFRSTLEPVLGTRLVLRVDTTDSVTARAAEDAAVAEADRLEALFSVYRPESAFNAWRSGELETPPPEIAEVLALAAEWFSRSGGAFHPGLGAAMQRWKQAEDEQRLPDPGEVRSLVPVALPFELRNGAVRRTGDCTALNVHGLAKGWIIDRMVDAALAIPAVDAVIVDLGGDLRHARRPGSSSTATVAVEDPFDPRDNARPMRVVTLTDQAMATSGGGRRGWTIDGRWFGHLLDPRTGWPLAEQRGATVVAASTAAADAAASAAVVDGTELLEALGVAALVVDAAGRVSTTSAWPAEVVERQTDR